MQFYIALEAGGKVYGPYDEAAVRKIISAGRVRADSYLSEDGGTWIRLGESRHFAALFAGQASAAPGQGGGPAAAAPVDEMADLAAAVSAERSGGAAGAAYGHAGGAHAVGHPPYKGRSRSGLAIGGFVCSLIGLFTCPFLLCLIGLILSASALSAMRRSRNYAGKGLAIAGVVLGILGLLVALGAVLFYFAASGGSHG